MESALRQEAKFLLLEAEEKKHKGKAKMSGVLVMRTKEKTTAEKADMDHRSDLDSKPPNIQFTHCKATYLSDHIARYRAKRAQITCHVDDFSPGKRGSALFSDCEGCVDLQAAPLGHFQDVAKTLRRAADQPGGATPQTKQLLGWLEREERRRGEQISILAEEVVRRRQNCKKYKKEGEELENEHYIERAVEAVLRDGHTRSGEMSLVQVGDALVWLVESARRKQWSRFHHQGE